LKEKEEEKNAHNLIKHLEYFVCSIFFSKDYCFFKKKRFFCLFCVRAKKKEKMRCPAEWMPLKGIE